MTPVTQESVFLLAEPQILLRTHVYICFELRGISLPLMVCYWHKKFEVIRLKTMMQCLSIRESERSRVLTDKSAMGCEIQ